MKLRQRLAQRFSILFRETIRLTDYIDTSAAEKSIRSNIYFRGPNAWILAIATIIASVGLNVNSIPVIIGAMLISPLMGPIFGVGLGLGINDMQLIKSSGKNLLVMVSISLVASFVYFLITPLNLTNPSEAMERAYKHAGGNGTNGKPVFNLTYQFTVTNNATGGVYTPMFDILRGKLDDHFRNLARALKEAME